MKGGEGGGGIGLPLHFLGGRGKFFNHNNLGWKNSEKERGEREGSVDTKLWLGVSVCVSKHALRHTIHTHKHTHKHTHRHTPTQFTHYFTSTHTHTHTHK